MKKASSEILHTASLGKNKKIRRLVHSSTEHWLAEDPDPMFATSLLSATESGSPAHLLPFSAQYPKEKKIRKKKKKKQSSISLTSFPCREEQQISSSEVPGAVIHCSKAESMSATSRMESVVRMLFARSSGNESLSPQEAQREERSVAEAIDEKQRMTSFRPRRLLHFLESSVPFRGRRQSLSSEGNEEREDERMISGGEERSGKCYSSPSLSSSPLKLSYSFDDIDRLIQMTPQRRKIEKNKKSSCCRRRQRGEDAEQDWEERMDQQRLLLLPHDESACDSASDASDQQELSQDYSAIPKARTRRDEPNKMKKCNSNFEMGSFSESTAQRKRIRRSGLFCEKGFAFREEDEQSEAFSGQMHQMDPDCGQQTPVMRGMAEYSERKAEYQDPGTGIQQAGDKSSPSSAPHHPYTICSKSLPGSQPSVQSSDMPQLTVSPGERSSAASGYPLSLPCNSLQFCRLCLEELPGSEFYRIASCGCSFCQSCLSLYLTIRIHDNLSVSSLSCPDACCPVSATAINNLITNNNSNAISSKKNLKFRLMRGFSFLRERKNAVLLEESKRKGHQVERVPNLMAKKEIEQLVDAKTFQLYKKLLLEAEVQSDPCRTFCPAADCDNICLITRQTSAVMSVSSTISSLSSVSPSAATAVLMSAKKLKRSASKTAIPVIYCCKCDKRFCFSCRQDYHPGLPCPSSSFSSQLLHLPAGGEEEGTDIKRCPRCSVWIERDEGCAQMMCRKCRHVFCWFCLQSLEDDFLLRHYDRGPCKNKLGHSRASVVWHRTQVVGIFAGFGVLLLLISPLFLIAAPCLLCCNCSSCPQPAADLLTPSSSFSASELDRKAEDRDLLFDD